MQLSKLRKNPHRDIKNRERLKYLSLGVMLQACAPPNSDQLARKMVDMDSCLHPSNSSEVLMADITDQLPDNVYRYQKINKLFAYFVRRVNQREREGEEKIEEEQRLPKTTTDQMVRAETSLLKVHSREQQKKHTAVVSQQMVKIYEEADKKHQIKKFKITKLEKQIEKLYIESHDLYTELMKIKQSIETETAELRSTFERAAEAEEDAEQQNSPRLTRNKAISEIAALNPEYIALSKKIAKVKESIQKKQEEHRSTIELEKPLAKEKTEFLKLLLKKGYKLSDGIWWILVKLAKDKQSLNRNDLYDALDGTSKDRLLLEYQIIKRDLFRSKGMLPKIKQSNWDGVRKNSEGIQRLMSIPAERNSKLIYRDTQEYIVDWVRKQRWKVRSLKHKATIDEESAVDWSVAEVRRLKNTYPKEEHEEMLMYIFGSVKYCHRMSVSRLEQFLSTRRHKDSSNSPEAIRSSQRGIKSVSSQFLSRNNTNK